MTRTDLEKAIEAWKIFDGAATPDQLRAAHDQLMAPYPADIESQPVNANGVTAESITAPPCSSSSAGGRVQRNSLPASQAGRSQRKRNSR
jgi:hypothetical protein